MHDSCDWMVQEFDRQCYPKGSRYKFIRSERLWTTPITKMDLMLRFIAAFRNGFGGILWGGHPMEQKAVQQWMDELYGKDKICTRRIGGALCLYLVPKGGWREEAWSFRVEATKYMDLFFQSSRVMEPRAVLMTSLRQYKRPCPSLLTMAWFQCSTKDLEYTSNKYD